MGDVRVAVIRMIDNDNSHDYSDLDALITQDDRRLLNELVEPEKTVLDLVEEAIATHDYYDGDKWWGKAEIERLRALATFLTERGARSFRDLPLAEELKAEVARRWAETNLDVHGRTPERVMYAFQTAAICRKEHEVRPLIVDHPDSTLLWQEAPPGTTSAATSAGTWKGGSYYRLEEGPDRVVLAGPSPVPLAVVRVNGEWRVDASPIIEACRDLK